MHSKDYRWMISLLYSFVVISLSATLAQLFKQYHDLDAVALNTGYLISMKGGINDEIEAFVKGECNGTIQPVNYGYNSAPVGTLYIYRINVPCKTAVLNKNKSYISVTRSVIIGKI